MVGVLFRPRSCLAQSATVGFSSPSARFCTVTRPSYPNSRDILLRNLRIALDDNNLREAWESFDDFRKLRGFPEDYDVNRLIAGLSYSSDKVWLSRACDLVVSNWRKRSGCFKVDVVSKLALSLARAQMPVPASIIVRLLLEKKFVVPMCVLRVIVLHLVKSYAGACLASNLLIQICSSSCVGIKLNDEMIVFNQVLEACERFELSLKGQQIVEWMAKKSVITDVKSLVHIVRIHEMNGFRDEIIHWKGYVDNLPGRLVSYSCSYYESLMSLHFKFDDIDAAASLALDLYNQHCYSPTRRDSQKPFLIPIGSRYLKNGLKLVFVPKLSETDHGFIREGKEELVIVQEGKLELSDRALAKFLYEYKSIGQMDRFSRLLLGIQNQTDASCRSYLVTRVIHACIHLGWLDSAHDLLDEFDAAGFTVCSSPYYALLKAYFTSDCHREATALAKQMEKAGIIRNITEDLASLLACVDAQCSDLSSEVEGSDLSLTVLQVINEKENSISSDVYELNSSLYYFCKAGMLVDARKTYRKLQETGMRPCEKTFAIMENGYSNLQMYREIAILWGDIKKSMTRGNFMINRDLCESLVLNFIRGGYFERVMEVIALMKEHHLFIDKWMFKHEFLSLHKNLYKNLEAWKARNDTQRQRLGHVQEFRKWAGIK